MGNVRTGAGLDGVSVVIPLFNKEPYVAEALASVTRYNRGPLEIVVVNDGSTDSGPDVVRRIRDDRIRLINQPNMGLSATRNVGIRSAKYHLVALLDADDWWYEGHLENLMNLQSSYPGVALFSNNFTRFGRPAIEPSYYVANPLVLSPDGFVAAMARITPMNSSSILTRRDALEAVGGFPTNVRHGEDYAVFIRLGLRSGAVLSPFVGAGYRQVPGSMSTGRIWAPGGGMRAISSILRESKALSAPMRRNLQALRARWALEYCSGALRRGHTTTARRFLALARGAKGKPMARLARLVLCNLPSPLAGLAMSLVDRGKGRTSFARDAGGSP